MLWVEYESSEKITKELVQEVVHRLYDLVIPWPVAAEDSKERDGINIIAYDGFREDRDDSSETISQHEECDCPRNHKHVQGSSSIRDCGDCGQTTAKNFREASGTRESES